MYGLILWFIFIRAMPFRPGLLRARFARLLLRNELNPTFPYRDCFILNYVFARYFRFFWIIRAMPSARAAPGSLSLGCFWRTKPCVSLSRLFYLELCFLRSISEFFELFGRCLRPGLLRARYTRLLLRNEPSPAYPYCIFITCCITSAVAGWWSPQDGDRTAVRPK